ncbi:hypothetical protein [Actinoallomurus acaciae]|uniref:Uncharacterized protein n=1 Tax=Actinoallomurus acaciae TaxID=502577 RepID=A0ABV5Y753_9ACTN
MSATQRPTPATDFWSALGVGDEASDHRDAEASSTPERQVSSGPGGSARTPAVPEATPAERAELDLEATVRDWASMFTGEAGSPDDDAVPAPASETAPAARDGSAPAPESASADEPMWPPQAPPPPFPGAEQPRSHVAVSGRVSEARMTPPAPRARAQDVIEHSAADRRGSSSAAEAPQGHADTAGDPTLLDDVQKFGHLWRDDRVDEIHIRGTQVNVCGTLGVYQVPGFSSLAMAHRAVAAAREEPGAVITYIGESVVVRRRRRTGPALATLVAAGIVTDEQLAEVRTALERTRSVVLAGPAAPVIMRSFTALLPHGSRVFEGPYAALPTWCVTAESPLDADYVVGVRPGAHAERMVALGQIGALIANPETQFEAAVEFGVRGRSAAPEKLVPGLPHR